MTTYQFGQLAFNILIYRPVFLLIGILYPLIAVITCAVVCVSAMWAVITDPSFWQMWKGCFVKALVPRKYVTDGRVSDGDR